MAVDQRDAAGELADLGQELTGTVLEQWGEMTETVAQRDRDMPRQHHEHAGTGLAGFTQRLPIPEGAQFAEPAHALDFVLGQRREGLLVARERERGRSRRRTGC